MTSLNAKHHRGLSSWIGYALRRIYLRAVCYRYAGHLEERTLPKSLRSLTEGSIRGKATASITSVGILFGFVAAALAAAAGSEDARKQFAAAFDVLQAVGLSGWLGVLIGVLLPYFVVWLERFISKVSVGEEQTRRRSWLENHQQG